MAERPKDQPYVIELPATTGSPFNAIWAHQLATSLDYTRNSFCKALACTPSMPPDATLNPIADAANPVRLYPIMISPAQQDANPRPLLALVQRWYDDAANDPIIRWYANYVPGTPGYGNIIWTKYRGVGSVPSYGASPRVEMAQVTDEDFADGSTGAYYIGMLECENFQVLHVGVYIAPKYAVDADQTVVQSKDVTSGKVIRGYTGTGRGSVGDMIHYLGGGFSDTEDTAENATRKCFSQLMYPRGYWTDSTSYQALWGDPSTWQIIPRRLGDFAAGGFDPTGVAPAIVISGDEGSEVRVTYDTSNTWTYTIPAGGIANPTLVDPSQGTVVGDMSYNGTVDEYLWEIKGPSGGGEMVLWTAALFEDPS